MRLIDIFNRNTRSISLYTVCQRLTLSGEPKNKWSWRLKLSCLSDKGASLDGFSQLSVRFSSEAGEVKHNLPFSLSHWRELGRGLKTRPYPIFDYTPHPGPLPQWEGRWTNFRLSRHQIVFWKLRTDDLAFSVCPSIDCVISRSF